MKKNILDFFDETLKTNGEKVAVIHNDEEITFHQLEEQAKRVANCILQTTDQAMNTPIAVFMPKTIHTVIADVGTMYSNNAFMNLDVKTPTERIQNILALVKPAIIITSKKFMPKLEGVDTPVMDIEEMVKCEPCDEVTLANRRFHMIDTDPFCIINTSGSTGTPKGVILNHRSFIDFMAWSIERFQLDGSEVIGSLSPVVFDIYDFELCSLMFKGSQMVLLDASLASFPARLLEMLNAKKVSFIFWVPSIMVNIANMDLLSRIPLETLKLVWFAGEVFPTKQFLYWYDKLPSTTFANLYGPIEITLDCTYYVVDKRPSENEPLPIGVPCENTDILIFNDEDKICEVGEEGELCVRGTSLAMGYYNNAPKTEAAFTQNPLNHSYNELIYRTGDLVFLGEDGLIHYKGRKDSLVKHMGYRIELGEIEHVIINDLKLVKYCCAVYQYQKKEICLYYESEKEITVPEFRKALGKVFPAYMVPSRYIRMDLLPRNTNGKIDRLKLKEEINKE